MPAIGLRPLVFSAPRSMSGRMRKVVLFIATTADGFIARDDGRYDWLPTDDNDYGYRAFIKTVGTVLMGRVTYQQVLDFESFPYADQECFVFSRRTRGLEKDPRRPPCVTIVRSDPVAFVRRLRRGRGPSIWLAGGAQLVQPLQEAGLIDEYVIFICPVFIGSGIPLFLRTKRQTRLRLAHRHVYESGVVELTYVKARTSG